MALEENERPLDSSDAGLEINPSAETQDSKSRLSIGVDLDTRVPIQVKKRRKHPRTFLYEVDEGGEKKRGRSPSSKRNIKLRTMKYKHQQMKMRL